MARMAKKILHTLFMLLLTTKNVVPNARSGGLLVFTVRDTAVKKVLEGSSLNVSHLPFFYNQKHDYFIHKFARRFWAKLFETSELSILASFRLGRC